MAMARKILNQGTVRDEFYAGLEASDYAAVIDKLSVRTNSDVEQEVYGWYEESGWPEKFEGRLQLEQPKIHNITVKNAEYRKALQVRSKEARRDQTGSWPRKVQEMGANFGGFQMDLLMDAMIAGATSGNSSYDGQTFFDTDHSLGDSGTQKNILTASEVGALNVATAASPTPEEAVDALMGVVGEILGFLDAGGKPLNANARAFTVIARHSLWAPFITAMRANNLDSGETNIVRGIQADGFTFDFVPWPLISSTTQFYVARTDGVGRKPFIFQEETPATVDLIEGGEYEDLNEQKVVKAAWDGAIGYGEPLHIVRATLS